MKKLIFSLVVLLNVCGIAVFSQGIQTGSITGSIVDASGAVLPGATITVQDLARGTKFTTTSQGDGNFSFQALPIGTYSLRISAPGFKTTALPTVSVSSGSDHALGRQALSAGDSSVVTVEASSNNAELNVSQSQISTTFDSQEIASLPLNNGFDEVALLEPGVAQTHDLNFSNTNGAAFSSNGTRGRSNNFELDGQSNNDNSVAGPQIFFGNQDAIAEIQVVQTNFSAQYGRNTGSVVNYITKSGTNSFHGSGFEFYTGSFLTSYPNQDKNALFGYCVSGQTTGCTPVAPLPRSVDNKYGGTFGGPIIKDKLFAFGSTYWEHTRNGASPFNSGASLTPTPDGLTMLASLFPGNPAVTVLTKYGPYGVTVGNPQPVLSAASTEPVTTPSGTTANIPIAPVLRIAPSGNYADQEDMGRLDWQATPKDRFYMRYFYQNSNSSNNPDGGAAGTFYDVPDKNYSLGADYTHIFSPAWLNQLRYSYQESKLDFQAGSFPNCTVNTLTACPGYLGFAGTDLSFGEATNLPQGRTVKVTQVQDNVSFTKGKQTILFGGEYDYQNSPNVFLPNYNGAGLFADLDHFIHEDGNFSLATGNPLLPFTENDYALYFQDDYKVLPTLTLNAGLRWEFFGQAINELHKLTVARESNASTAIWDPTLPLSERTTASVKNAYKNFEPRLGLVWNPSFDPKMVIHAGYSIGFDPAFYNIFLNAATVAPVATSGQFACGGNCLGSGDFSGAGLRSTNLSKLPIGGNPADSDQDYVPTNFHNPYLQTYSLGIDHQVTSKMVVTVRYVGTHGVGNFQALDANPDLSTVQAAFPNAVNVGLCTTTGSPGIGRPNCNLGNLAYVSNSSFTIYNSIQTQATMKNFHGFTGTVNYTFSQAQDNSSEIFSTGAGGNTIALPQNPLNTDLGERGRSGFSLPNVFSAGLTYTLPRLSLGSGLVNRAVNGVQFNAIYQYNSGQGYNPYQPLLGLYGLDPSYCDNTFNASTVGPGADSCRLVLNNKNAPLQSVGFLQGGVINDLATGNVVDQSTEHWLLNNTDIANQLGNPYPGSGRNILRAQPFNNLDASFFKDTRVNDRFTVELQFNAYNALNHQYRGTPLANAFYDSPGINPFLSNAYNTSGSRTIQFGGKIKF